MKGIGKGKGKIKDSKGLKNPKPKPKPTSQEKPPKEGTCHFYNESGYWKRNCKLYLDDLKKNKGNMTISPGVHVIEVNLSTSDSWVLDTGSISHIRTNVQGLKRSRILAKGEVDLRVRNGARVDALAVGTYDMMKRVELYTLVSRT